MITELKKYENAGSFIYKPQDRLAQICNAPNDKAGIYLVYTIQGKERTLVYIGRSGKTERNGTLFIRKGGIKDRLVNGKRDGELRRNFWLREMINGALDALEIQWFATHDQNYIDCPAIIEDQLIKKYKPLWNR